MADHGLVHIITSKQDWDTKLQEASDEGKVVVVDFTAVWCGPCRRIAPEFAKFSETFPNIVFLKVDVDDVPEVAEECGIEAMPTFQVFKGNERVEQLVGASIERLQTLIESYA